MPIDAPTTAPAPAPPPAPAAVTPAVIHRSFRRYPDPLASWSRECSAPTTLLARPPRSKWVQVPPRPWRFASSATVTRQRAAQGAVSASAGRRGYSPARDTGNMEASVRFAAPKVAAVRVAPDKLATIRSATISVVPDKSSLAKSASARSAPRQSGRQRGQVGGSVHGVPQHQQHASKVESWAAPYGHRHAPLTRRHRPPATAVPRLQLQQGQPHHARMARRTATQRWR